MVQILEKLKNAATVEDRTKMQLGQSKVFF